MVDRLGRRPPLTFPKFSSHLSYSSLLLQFFYSQVLCSTVFIVFYTVVRESLTMLVRVYSIINGSITISIITTTINTTNTVTV